MLESQHPIRHTTPSHEQDLRPVGEIIQDLWSNSETLVRQEVSAALAQLDVRVADLKGRLSKATINAGILYAGILTIVASITLLLAKVVEPWLSALIVGALLCVVSAVLYESEKKGSSHEADPSSPTTRIPHRRTKEIER
jgi:hypothetical protein